MISVNNTSAKAKNKLATQEYGTRPTKAHPFLMHIKYLRDTSIRLNKRDGGWCRYVR